ncbi:MAG: signal recognition particle receptor subunit alpha [Pirellulaceae bacterium]|nr:signal recognition particle receptor subunit alpha [Pirellulaceae bacterium]
MFDSLQDGLKTAFKSLRGKGKLTEGNMRDGLRLVEQSLLEADVSYSVVKDFMAEVSQRALGEKVLLALDPSQQVVGIVHEELLRPVFAPEKRYQHPDALRAAGVWKDDHLRQIGAAAVGKQG